MTFVHRAREHDDVPVALRSLAPETFGDRLARARNTSHLGLRTAAALISQQVMPVSFATLSRLEDLPEAPAPNDPRRRMLATLTVLAYGYEPEEFGLSIDDLPRSLDVDAFLEARETALRSRSFAA